jgi:unsaturated rhamnogalacturonyl hydrolase
MDSDTIAAAVRLADAQLARRAPEEIGWSWGAGIFLYGLARLAVAAPAARTRYLEAIARYHRSWARRAPRIDRADACAPALSALALARDHGCAAGLPAAARVAQFAARAPRNRLGAIDHLGVSPLRLIFPGSIWTDSLAMLAVFCAQWGAYVGDAELLDFGAAQPGAYAAKLQDSAEGLFRHAYLLRLDRAVPRAPAFWLRGNGWATLAMVDAAGELPGGHPGLGEIVALLGACARGLARWQREDGGWGTVINDPRSYDETSGAALCAYALAKAVRLRLLPASMQDVAHRARAHVTALLEPAPGGLSLPGVSAATNPMPAFGYRLVPRVRDAPWGVGAYLLAAAESP